MMRDYRDAKVMARALRFGLTDQGVKLTHSQSLELMAKAFGFDNWNILAAKTDTARPAEAPPDGPKTFHCSFCKKSQHDVKTLIAGPDTFICDECVGLCGEIVEHGEVLAVLATGGAAKVETYLATRSGDQLRAYLAKVERDLARGRDGLETLKRALAARRGGRPVEQPWLDLPESVLANREGEAQLRLGATEQIQRVVTEMLETPA